MQWDRPEPEYPDTRARDLRDLTVRRRIEILLDHDRGRWYTLSQIQKAIYSSSCRSRLQEIMQDDRELPEGERLYEERPVHGKSTSGRPVTWKEYRRRPPGSQGQLFHVPPDPLRR